MSSDEPWLLNVVPLQPADQASLRKSSLVSENHPFPHPRTAPWHGEWQAGETSFLLSLVWSVLYVGLLVIYIHIHIYMVAVKKYIYICIDCLVAFGWGRFNRRCLLFSLR